MTKNIHQPYASEAGIYSEDAWNTVRGLDPWVCSSLLQKAIRRGDTELAVASGLRLHQLRGAAIWSRLLLITVEDIGIASPSAVSLAVKIAKLIRGQSSGDVTGALAHLIEMLALAPKCRCSDYLVSTTYSHTSFESERCMVGELSIEQRIGVAADTSKPIVTRAIAAWFASGLNWSGESRVGKGNLKALLSAFTGSDVPHEFLSDVAYACERTKHPIAIMLPVLWSAANAYANDSFPLISDIAASASPSIRGVPAYAYDKHTYAGKAAIGRLAVENAEVAKVLSKWVPDFRGRDATAMAAFYVDAIPVRPQYIWQRSVELERLGREADFLHVGFPTQGIEELMEAVSGNLGHLNDLRNQCSSRRNSKEGLINA